MDVRHFDARNCRGANLMTIFENGAILFMTGITFEQDTDTPRLPNKLPIEHSDSQLEI